MWLACGFYTDWSFIFAGIVNLIPPNGTVSYNSYANFTCKTEEDLKSEPKWTLIRPDKTEFEITNGTSAKVYPVVNKQASITVSNITELWAGLFQYLLFTVNKGSVVDSVFDGNFIASLYLNSTEFQM